jgi:hypothetical protein
MTSALRNAKLSGRVATLCCAGSRPGPAVESCRRNRCSTAWRHMRREGDARWQMRRRSRMAAAFTSSWLWVRSPSIAAPTVVLDRSSVGSRGLPDGPRCNVNPRPCTAEWPEKLCRDRAQSTFCDASRREEQFGTQPSERAARAGALVTLYGRPVSYE